MDNRTCKVVYAVYQVFVFPRVCMEFDADGGCVVFFLPKLDTVGKNTTRLVTTMCVSDRKARAARGPMARKNITRLLSIGRA